MAGAGGKEVGRLSIRVVPDMDGFREKVEAEARGAGKDVRIPVDADTREARRKIDEIKDEKGRAVVDLDADTRGVREKIKAETSGIRAKVHVDVDESELQRIKNRIRNSDRGGDPVRSGFLGGAGFAAMLGNIKIPDIAPNFMGLGGFASIGLIVAALSLLAPALALVSQALVGLPALVSGFALPLGVAALGFKGIKKALDDSGILKDDQEFDKKGKPKGKAKQGLGTVLKELQDQVSDVFATGLKPVFQQIAGVIPELARGLPFVAQGLVHMAQGLGNILSTPAFVQGFDRFTNSVGTMLTNLSPALQLFTSAMTNLVFNVGDHLPGLANKMTEWAGEFQNWVGRISKPQNFWGKDMPNSSVLDKAVKNIGPILDTLFNSIGGLVNRGLDLAGKGDITKGIQDTFTGIEHLIEQLSRLGPVFEGLATTLNTIHGITDPRPDPKAPYGTRPGPAGSGTTIPITHAEAMQQHVGLVDDPIQWLGDKAKGFLGHMLDGAAKFVTEQTIGGNLLSMLFGGSTPKAGAAPEPFNAGTPVGGKGTFWGVPTQEPPPQVSADGGAGATAPPVAPIKAPKIEAPKLPPGSEKMWDPVVQATQAAGAQINGEVSSWSGKIKSALDSASAGARSSGAAIGPQFAAGISSGEGAAVAAAHHLADAVKGALPHSPAKHGPLSGAGWTQVKDSGTAVASQWADGLDQGYDGVVAAAQRLAQVVHDSMTKNGGILPPQVAADVKRESSAIGIELDKLKQQRDALDPKDKKGRAAVKSQMDQLQDLRDTLGLDSKQSAYDDKYGSGKQSNSMQEAASMITGALAQALDGLKSIISAPGKQLESDLGIGGNGALEAIGQYGVGFLSQSLNSVAQSAFGGKGSGTTINVGSIDEGLAAKQSLDNRQALQHQANGRG